MVKDTRDWGSYESNPETNRRIRNYLETGIVPPRNGREQFQLAFARISNKIKERDEYFLKHQSKADTPRKKAELLLKCNYVTNPHFINMAEDIINSTFQSQLAIVRKRQKPVS